MGVKQEWVLRPELGWGAWTFHLFMVQQSWCAVILLVQLIYPHACEFPVIWSLTPPVAAGVQYYECQTSTTVLPHPFFASSLHILHLLDTVCIGCYLKACCKNAYKSYMRIPFLLDFTFNKSPVLVSPSLFFNGMAFCVCTWCHFVILLIAILPFYIQNTCELVDLRFGLCKQFFVLFFYLYIYASKRCLGCVFSVCCLHDHISIVSLEPGQ